MKIASHLILNWGIFESRKGHNFNRLNLHGIFRHLHVNLLKHSNVWFYVNVLSQLWLNLNTNHLLMMPLIWQSFSICCCFRRRSLSSRRFWYCCRILFVCCSCVISLCSYSSSFRWDILSRSFKECISSSYSFTWKEIKSNFSCVVAGVQKHSGMCDFVNISTALHHSLC